MFAICGAAYGDKMTRIKFNQVKDCNTEIIVRIPVAKTTKIRFVQIRSEHLDIVRRYMLLRPPHIATDRFLIQFRNSKCTTQHVGKNSIKNMSCRVAQYLGLPEPTKYTAQSFRVVDANTDINLLDATSDTTSNDKPQTYSVISNDSLNFR